MVEMLLHIAPSLQDGRTMQFRQATCDDAQWFACRVQIQSCDNDSAANWVIPIPFKLHAFTPASNLHKSHNFINDSYLHVLSTRFGYDGSARGARSERCPPSSPNSGREMPCLPSVKASSPP